MNGSARHKTGVRYSGSRFCRQGGFTLVELVIVLVILGVLGGIVGPRFFDPGTVLERGFFDDTAAALRYARKLALATRCDTRVRLTLNSGFSVNQRANSCINGAFTRAVPHPGSGASTYDGIAPSGIGVSAADVIFRSDGSADADYLITIGSRQLRVVQSTGYVCGPVGVNGC